MSGLASREPLLAVQDLTVGHHVDLLRDVCIELHAGQSWIVVGENGSGKTTFVHTLLGLVAPRGGRIRCGAGVRSAIGYVPQDVRFDPALPVQVAEFVESGVDDRTSRRQARRRIGEALGSVGVAELARRDVRTLSTGQRRLVVVARAVVRRPALLVLDEPLANLDRESALALADDLDRRRQAGTCVVHVAHELAVARRHATHVAIVAAGRVRTGAVPHILDDATFRRLLGEGIG